MALLDEFREGLERFRAGIEELKALLQAHDVDGVRRLVDLHRHDAEFRSSWNAIWKRMAEDNGGKVSLTMAGAVLGAALGGAGVVAVGGMVGIPLLAVLGLGGLVAGAEVDAAARKLRMDSVKVELPYDLHARLHERAETLGVTLDVLLAKIVETALHSDEPISKAT